MHIFKHCLDKLLWDISLISLTLNPNPNTATSNSHHCGVRLTDDTLKPIPHHFSVNDKSTEIVPNPSSSGGQHQSNLQSSSQFRLIFNTGSHPIQQTSEHANVSFSSCILGQTVNIHQMDVETLPEFIVEMLEILHRHQTLGTAL